MNPARPRPHPRSTPRRPEGQPTRGKTHPNRLRRVDTLIARYDPALLRRESGPWASAWIVDLGYGAEPLTTLEMATRLRRLNPGLRILGVEIDPARVAAAQPLATARTAFRLGGFNLPLEIAPGSDAPEPVRLIRAFNVLRQYDEHAVAPAWQRLGSTLLTGGLLVEGTSDPLGRLFVANILRKQQGGLDPEALVFSTRFRGDFEPAAFQAVLPKNLIHHIAPGEAIHDFFRAWTHAARVTSPLRVWGDSQWFAAAGRTLAHEGWQLDTRSHWLRDGYLILRSLDRRSPDCRPPNQPITQ